MYFFIKKLFDLFFSVFLLTFLAPFFLLISILIKLTSKGSVFFEQKRIGLEGKAFKIYKFRTMIENAEKMGTGLDSYEGDPRVTKIGRLLRASSLDELPQLFNIFKGDMSFVGPRPPTTYHPYKYQDYPEKQKVRFTTKPGVTGWAQVNGRNELSWNEKIAFDLVYIDKISFLFDMKILCLTVVKVLKNEGSYDKA